MVPVVAVLSFQITGLLGGALIVEQVFSINGLGTLAIGAVRQQDIRIRRRPIRRAAEHRPVGAAERRLAAAPDQRTGNRRADVHPPRRGVALRDHVGDAAGDVAARTNGA